MTRRSLTFVVAGALLVALVAVAALLPVPYVVFSPGPVADTLGEVDGGPVIVVEGHPTYPTTGELNFTTVGVTPAHVQLGLGSAFRAWFNSDVAVVPRELIYPNDVPAEEVRERNAELMERSQETAKVAALRTAGIRVPEVVVVDAIVEGAPALGRLQAGDIITSVDGEPVSGPEAVRDGVTRHRPGETVTFEVVRGDESLTIDVPTEPADDDPDRAVVGILPSVGYDFPFEIEIRLGEEIGGSSAGLMFALGIYDKITPGPLTGGLEVAGTGTVGADGGVGPIGGIQQKVIAAEEEGAALFLAPADNCRDLAGVESDTLQIVRIEKMEEAVQALELAASGQVENLPRCD